ncbi:MAG TPA: DNA-directed RNA polymerase subunit delta [Pseudogracilibacillus sp.]|nr:DNA-directed RNA polymerase subunit delta [Pseudogracilibacillus sp.]
MALKKYSDEQINKMSMIEVATLVLGDQKKEMDFSELFQQVTELKKISESKKQELLATFYTDLNIDGRFMALGSNVWGLKRWYPVDQTTEKSLAASRKRHMEEMTEDNEEDDEDFDDDYDVYEEVDEEV